MRKFNEVDGVSVQCIAGTYVVILGMNVLTAARRKQLLGFAIHRTDATEKEAYWLKGFRTFEATDPNPSPGSLVSTHEHPIQAFTWGDYTAKPNHQYTYKVVPMYGQPKNLIEGKAVSVTVNTSNEDVGKHAIFFNRGAAGSQAYARRFKNIAPEDIKDKAKQKAAYAWLSRGLEEAILAFIGQANDKNYALHAAVYEFSHPPVLEAFRKAADRGAKVKIVYDRTGHSGYTKKGNKRPDPVWVATETAARKAGILTPEIMIKRLGSPIKHNKFIVLLYKGEPVQVWTGSTNFTAGGIFGQSNVGHRIKDKALAKAYFDYWTRLSANPKSKDLCERNKQASPVPKGAPTTGLTPIFSPRPDLTALEWYGQRLDKASSSAGFTAAFGISSVLAGPLQKQRNYLRYIMVEKKGQKRPGKKSEFNPQGLSQYEIYQKVNAIKNNRVALGSFLEARRTAHAHAADEAMGGELHRWLVEKLTGLNSFVNYLHTKYMIIDSLTDNPTVISGSANFSSASTTKNDENMVVVHGNTDVSDIFFGEFHRLFDHFYFRQVADAHAKISSGQKKQEYSPYLEPDDKWTDRYFKKGSIHYMERLQLAGKRKKAAKKK